MSHQIITLSKSTTAAVVLLLLSSVALAACGSSSSTTSTAAGAAASSTGATGSARFAAIRECMGKQGITLPKRTPGQRRPPGTGGLLGSAPQLPAGVTRAQYEAALKKCGATFADHGPGGAGRFASPAAKAALVKFAACVRSAGINIAAPNTSGKGPIFNTNSVNTSSPQFQAAMTRCSSILHIQRGIGTGGATGETPGAIG